MTTWPVHGRIDGPIVMIGFGSIGKGVLPLIERHFKYDRNRLIVIEPREFNRDGKPSLNLAEFAADQGVDDLIVINYPYMINSKAFIRYLNALAGVQ